MLPLLALALLAGCWQGGRASSLAAISPALDHLPTQGFAAGSGMAAEEGQAGMRVSKSVSVSKVSVKVGDVRVAAEEPQEDLLVTNYWKNLLFQLNSINHAQNSDIDYQLIYKDDYFDSDELDNLSDDYLNYLYDIYDEIDYVYNSDSASLEAIQNDNELAPSAQTAEILVEDNKKSEVLEAETNKQLITNTENEKFKNIFDLNIKAIPILHERATTEKYTTTEQPEPEMVKTEERAFMVEITGTEGDVDVYIKIGIFVTISAAVLVVSAMLVLAVARRNSKTVIAKLATNEDSSGGGLPSQLVFHRSSRHNSSTDPFNISKSVGLYDDLHSLDNDAFLTSLETISIKDRFDID